MVSPETGSDYVTFEATGLNNPEKGLGKLAARFFSDFNFPDAVRMLQQNTFLEPLLIQDAEIEKHMKESEIFAEIIIEDILSQPECRELAFNFLTSIHHGINHNRRGGRWLKAINANDRVLRTDKSYLLFSPSAFISIWSHDFAEVETGIKEHHDAAAALFILGYLHENKTRLFDLYKSKTFYEQDNSIPDEEIEKIIWGAAFINLHHSKPEKVQDIDSLVMNGLFDIKELITAVEEEASKQGMTIYEYYKPYNSIRDFIESVKSTGYKSPRFTYKESLGLYHQLLAVAAADKLDSNFPADLATTRMLLTKPNRIAYRKMAGLSSEAEFKARVLDGSGQESECDLNRILFELTRTKSFDFSPWVTRAFQVGLVKRGQFILEIYPEFLKGNFEPVLKCYEKLEADIIKTTLTIAGIDDSVIKSTLQINSKHKRRAEIAEEYLKGKRIDPHSFQYALEQLEIERQTISIALVKKFNLLGNIEETEIIHIKELLMHALDYQRQTMHSVRKSLDFDLPYEGYYLIYPLNKLKLNFNLL